MSYEYRTVQINDSARFRSERYGVDGKPPVYNVYPTLEAARGRVNQLKGIPDVRIKEIQRRRVSDWETVE